MYASKGSDIKNIIFVVADSLRVSNIGCYGYSKSVTPTIDDFAKESILFENCFSCSNNSDSSLISLLSGNFPRTHGVISHGSRIKKEDLERLPRLPLLAEVLKNNFNYKTMGISILGGLPRSITTWHTRGYDHFYSGVNKMGIPSLMPSSVGLRARKLVHSFGLDKYFEKVKSIRNNVGLAGYNAKIVTNTAIDFIEKNKNNPFFLFVDYLDAHAPYRPPPEYLKKFYVPTTDSSTDRENMNDLFSTLYEKDWLLYLKSWLMNAPNLDYILAQYDGVVNFIDNEFGRLMKAVNKSLSSEETFLVFTSDHGESLLEHGIFFDHHGLYDVTIHVPLILKYPGCPSNKRIESFVQHTDIVPTLFNLMNFSSPKMDGKSLLPLINNGTKLNSKVFIEEGSTEWKIAIRTKDYKYIYAPSKNATICRYCDKIHGGFEELYDLNADPEETRNIVEERSEIAGELKNNLLQWTSSFPKIHYPVNLYALEFPEEYYYQRTTLKRS